MTLTEPSFLRLRDSFHIGFYVDSRFEREGMCFEYSPSGSWVYRPIYRRMIRLGLGWWVFSVFIETKPFHK